MGNWTLRRKLVTFVLVVMIMFLAVRGVAWASQSYDIYLRFVLEEAESTAQTLAVAIGQGDYWNEPARMQEFLSTLQDQAGQMENGGLVGRGNREILITDHSGQVVAATDPEMVGALLPQAAQLALARAIDEGVMQTFGVKSGSGMVYHLAVPIEINGQRDGALSVQYFQDPARVLARASVVSELFTFTVLTAALVLILLVGLRKMVLRPLAILEEGAAYVGAGDLDVRIDLETGDELETVACAFNRMAGSLKVFQAEQVAREKQETLMEVACVTASELSQPLTVVLGYAELLQEQGVPTPEFFEEAVTSIQRSSQRMVAIIRQLSSLSGGYGLPAYSNYSLSALAVQSGLTSGSQMPGEARELAFRMNKCGLA